MLDLDDRLRATVLIIKAQIPEELTLLHCRVENSESELFPGEEDDALREEYYIAIDRFTGTLDDKERVALFELSERLRLPNEAPSLRLGVEAILQSELESRDAGDFLRGLLVV